MSTARRAKFSIAVLEKEKGERRERVRDRERGVGIWDRESQDLS